MVVVTEDLHRMRSTHSVRYGTAMAMKDIGNESIDLVVTSPPYPMIEMWDQVFSNQSDEVKEAMNKSDGNRAFELMHSLLDCAWHEVYRVLKPGAFACINIGDATRTIKDHFRLYSNHARILNYCLSLGFSIGLRLSGGSRQMLRTSSWGQVCFPLVHTSRLSMNSYLC